MRNAPFVYFDSVGVNGVLNGAVEVELRARTMEPGEDGPLVKVVDVAHLRCSPAAAAMLILALQNSLDMFKEMHEPPPHQVN